MRKKWIVAAVIALILIIDQALKVYIKLNFSISEGFNILGLDWARIHFIENKGMAFGLSYGGMLGKYALSIFRIVMVFILFYLLRRMMKDKEPLGLLISFSMIIAGAIGNIIDSMFYGLIFSRSCYKCRIAEFMPDEGGYAGFLQGWVVDMFYFPMINSQFPDWFPFVGGNEFEFFRPVFNVADASISVGVALILIFHRTYFLKDRKKTEALN